MEGRGHKDSTLINRINALIPETMETQFFLPHDSFIESRCVYEKRLPGTRLAITWIFDTAAFRSRRNKHLQSIN